MLINFKLIIYTVIIPYKIQIIIIIVINKIIQ